MPGCGCGGGKWTPNAQQQAQAVAQREARIQRGQPSRLPASQTWNGPQAPAKQPAAS